MNVLVTLTSAGIDTGPFYLYSNYNNYTVPIDSGIPRDALLAGYVCTTVPSGATYIRVESTGDCTNHVDIAISFPTTTTTTSTSFPKSAIACTTDFIAFASDKRGVTSLKVIHGVGQSGIVLIKEAA